MEMVGRIIMLTVFLVCGSFAVAFPIAVGVKLALMAAGSFL